MNKVSFVHVSYIASTPEKVWKALFDVEMTRQYWGVHRNVSDWKVGSKWAHQDCDTGEEHVVGEVVEFDAPKRLVLTWRSGQTPPSEGPSRVTFQIDAFMGAVKLTVTHEDIEAGSPMWKGVSTGWPAILSSMKTLLETGKAMEMTTRRWSGPPT